MVTSLSVRYAAIALALFSNAAQLAGQQLSFYRGYRDALFRGVHGQAMAPSDVNQDGLIDVVLALCCDELAVLFGTANGAFVAGPQSIPSAYVGDASNLLSADFNADGKPDVIVGGTSETFFLPGDGTGGFGTPVKLQFGSGRLLTVVEVNGDNKPDLFLFDGNGTIRVLWNNGDGTFTYSPGMASGFGPKTTSVGAPYAATVGDLNRDGRQDIVVAGKRGGEPHLIHVLLGTAAGELERFAFFPSGPAHHLGLGDFNTDGILDIAQINSDHDVRTLTTFHGMGDGSFGAPLYHKLPFRATGFGIGDLNGDSVDDIVLTSSGQTLIRRGNGDGTFVSIAGPTVSERASSPVLVVDVNQDGRPDALIGGRFFTVSALFGNGDGTLRHPPMFHLPPQTSGASSGDFNGDTLTDFAVANSTSGTVSVFLTNPAGGLTKAGTSSAPGVSSIHAADFDRDQKLDLISLTSTRDAIRALRGNGNGTFTALPPISLPGLQLFAPVVGEFNGDNKSDILIGSEATNGLLLFTGNGDGTFASPVPVIPAGTRLRCYTAGEFTGDRRLDIAYVSNTNLRIIPGNGNGTFGTPSPVIARNIHAFEMISGDLNRDGRGDLVIAGVRVALGNGNGTFQPLSLYFGGPDRERGLGIADLNGDGTPDIYFGTFLGGNGTGVLLGRGDGTFLPARFFSAGREPLLPIPIHFLNADSRPDLAVVNAESNSVTLLVNTTGLAAPEQITIPSLHGVH